MIIRTLTFAAGWALLILISVSASHAATFITFDVSGAKQTYAEDIDGQGNVVGNYDDNLGQRHGFIRLVDGTFQLYSEQYSVNPAAISDGGIITGSTTESPGRAFSGALDGTINSFKNKQLSALRGIAINSAGAIAGYGNDQLQVYHGFLRTKKNRIEILDAPNAGTGYQQGTQPEAISDDGVIAGEAISNAGTHGFLRDKKGNMLAFDPPGSLFTLVSSVSKDDAVLGRYVDASLASHAYLRTARGDYSTFDAPGAGTNLGQGTMLSDVNAKGVIVGSMIDSNGVYHGYIRSKAGKFTSVDAPGAGTNSDEGTLVLHENDNGQIVGVYYDDHLQQHGFIRLP